MSLRARLKRLEHKQPRAGSVAVWLYDLDDNTVTGPDGKSYTVEQAKRLQVATPVRFTFDLGRLPHES